MVSKHWRVFHHINNSNLLGCVVSQSRFGRLVFDGRSRVYNHRVNKEVTRIEVRHKRGKLFCDASNSLFTQG